MRICIKIKSHFFRKCFQILWTRQNRMPEEGVFNSPEVILLQFKTNDRPKWRHFQRFQFFPARKNMTWLSISLGDYMRCEFRNMRNNPLFWNSKGVEITNWEWIFFTKLTNVTIWVQYSILFLSFPEFGKTFSLKAKRRSSGEVMDAPTDER